MHASDLGLLSRALSEASGELGLINLNPLHSGREVSLGRKTARERPTTAAVMLSTMDTRYCILGGNSSFFDVHKLTHSFPCGRVQFNRHLKFKAWVKAWVKDEVKDVFTDR